MRRNPHASHSQELSPDVAARWWYHGNLDLYWRAPAQGDSVHEDGTPLLRVSGTLNNHEVRALYEFLGTLLEES